MATRRVTKSAIDWKRFQQLVPQSHQPQLSVLIGKNYQYVSKVASLPEALPKIDFESYKKQAPEKAKIFDTFEKTYTTLQVPYPQDTEGLLGKINQLEKAEESRVKAHLDGVEKKISELQSKKDLLSNRPPVEEMTVELSQYYSPQKELSDNELFGECPHTKMLEEQKKAKLLGGKGGHH